MRAPINVRSTLPCTDTHTQRYIHACTCVRAHTHTHAFPSAHATPTDEVFLVRNGKNYKFHHKSNGNPQKELKEVTGSHLHVINYDKWIKRSRGWNNRQWEFPVLST